MFKKTLETVKYTVKLSVFGVLCLPLMILLRGITPHILQFVKATIFGQHHVDYDIHVIDQYPLVSLSAFVFIGKFIAIFTHLFFNGIGDSLYLGGTGALTDDEKVRYCFGYLSKVEGNYVITFLLLDRFYDIFKNFRISCQPHYAIALPGG
jgi:hypothetical protein